MSDPYEYLKGQYRKKDGQWVQYWVCGACLVFWSDDWSQHQALCNRHRGHARCGPLLQGYSPEPKFKPALGELELLASTYQGSDFCGSDDSSP